MKRLFVAAAFLLFLGNHSQADEKDAVRQARSAARSWLSLIDSAQYGPSWDEAAALFKDSITKSDWEQALEGVRAPLGDVKSRKLKSATFTRSLPGVPDGEYVVIQLNTQFENKDEAVETITPMREKDGSWRVSGYFIQ